MAAAAPGQEAGWQRGQPDGFLYRQRSTRAQGEARNAGQGRSLLRLAWQRSRAHMAARAHTMAPKAAPQRLPAQIGSIPVAFSIADSCCHGPSATGRPPSSGAGLLHPRAPASPHTAPRLLLHAMASAVANAGCPGQAAAARLNGRTQRAAPPAACARHPNLAGAVRMCANAAGDAHPSTHKALIVRSHLLWQTEKRAAGCSLAPLRPPRPDAVAPGARHASPTCQHPLCLARVHCA